MQFSHFLVKLYPNCTKKHVIGERAKLARHFQVCSIENHIVRAIRANFVLITRKEVGT